MIMWGTIKEFVKNMVSKFLLLEVLLSACFDSKNFNGKYHQWGPLLKKACMRITKENCIKLKTSDASLIT